MDNFVNMAAMTFTTDWGTRDFGVAAMKGLMITGMPDIRCVDISHEVARHNIQQAAYIFGNAYTYFPAGTLHFIGVRGSLSQPAEMLCIKKDQHLFIGQNDGFFSLVFDEPPVDMVSLDLPEGYSGIYDLRAICKAAVHLLTGNNLYELGDRPGNFIRRSAFLPTTDDELISGVVIYVDDFGNIVTNITRELFEKQRKGRMFEIVARKSQYSVNAISNHYNEVVPGGSLALFNDAGYLEIAICEDSAFRLMNLRLNDIVRIEFR